MRAYHTSLFTILCSSLFVACGGGTSSGTDEPSDTGGVDAAAESGATTDSATVEETAVDAGDTSVTTADANDTAVVETCPTEDPLDDDGRDDNCDGAEGVAADGIYVDPINGVDVQNGAPEHPVQTVERALALFTARPARNTVYLAKGTTKYDGTAIGTLLSNGCSVVGGLDPAKKWSRPEGTASPIDATTIESPLSGVRVLGSPGARLWWAKITNTGAKDSAHSYGMVIRKSPLLTLHRVFVFAAAGPAGPSTAADGSAGIAGGNGGDPRHQEGVQFETSRTLGGLPFGFTTPPDAYVPRSGGKGGNGCGFAYGELGCESPGDPGRTGAGTLVGTKATVSRAGGNGIQGGHGAFASAPGALHWKWDDSSASIVTQTLFGRTGNDGSGGEGGGGGKYELFNGSLARCEPGGGGGAGGGGGTAGTGGASGTPGGFSIGIAIVDPDSDALPTFESVSVESSAGGVGGTGGRGGSGGRGGAGGAAGVPALQPFGTGCRDMGSANGFRGGDGGHGGSGSSGPGGMGGSSIGVLVVSKTSTASPFGISTTVGVGGAGGASGPAAPPIVTGQPAGNRSAAGIAGIATGFLWLDVNRAFPTP